jgi:hypothetical protein
MSQSQVPTIETLRNRAPLGKLPVCTGCRRTFDTDGYLVSKEVLDQNDGYCNRCAERTNAAHALGIATDVIDLPKNAARITAAIASQTCTCTGDCRNGCMSLCPVCDIEVHPEFTERVNALPPVILTDDDVPF